MEKTRELKVLVIDEEPQYFQALRDCADMCSHLFRVRCDFANSKEAISATLAKKRPSIVLLDLYVPDISCPQVIKDCQNLGIPVIVIAPEFSHPSEQGIESLGATGYVMKSEDPEEIEGILRSMVRFADEAVESSN